MEQVNWDLFQREFQKKYVGELYIEDRKQEFLMLKQGKMSVVDFEREFSRHSRYAAEFYQQKLIVIRDFYEDYVMNYMCNWYLSES